MGIYSDVTVRRSENLGRCHDTEGLRRPLFTVSVKYGEGALSVQSGKLLVRDCAEFLGCREGIR